MLVSTKILYVLQVEYLVQSREASLENFEQRLEICEREANAAKAELREIEGQMSAAREELSTLSNQRNKLQQKSNQLSAIIRQADNEQHLGTVDNFETYVYTLIKFVV